WLSADTWTLIATYLRNLVLNWAILVPLLLGVLAIPRLFVAVAPLDVHDATWPWVTGSARLCLGWGVLSLVVCQWTPVRSRRDRVTEAIARQGGFLILCLTPMVWATVAFMTTWAWTSNAKAGGWTPIALFQAHDLLPAGPVREWADYYALFA